MAKSRILIADDEKNTCRYIKQHIKMEPDINADIDFAHHLDQAIKMLDENPSYDLILIDLWMPDHIGTLDRKAGIKILEKSRSLQPIPQAITVTANSSSQTALETSGLGVYDYVTKPINYTELINMIKDILNRPNNKYIEDTSDIFEEEEIIGRSQSMIEVMKKVGRVASSSADVLIYGETGTGKDLIARAIHQYSNRCNGPFIPVNCSAIPSELIEAELFGIGKQVATSVNQRIGKFQRANGGTIFLDEIGDLSLKMQPKLLRALDYKEIQRVGQSIEKVDVRVIAATNRSLLEATKEGIFRSDLYYRLSFIIDLPPLRERKGDIPLLANHFLKKYAKSVEQRRIQGFSPDVLKKFEKNRWDGNIRELEKVVEYATITCRSEYISDADLPSWQFDQTNLNPKNMQNTLENLIDSKTIKEASQKFERLFLERKFKGNNWNVQLTADEIGLTRQSLHRKMKALGLKREQAKTFE
ncbi:MAG: sigma-54 dependent transcriptional regulator [Candidatus Poribacteria bacterium]|nr:sigma-54 dependent transcriptional regulator [Candidatus Poribacteria bacterium]